jgi:membrane fusion protein, multidrug efflux system
MAQDDEKNAVETEVETAPADEPKKSRLPMYLAGGVLLLGAIIGTIWWLNTRQYETTDDSFLDGNISQVSPKISARIIKINVKENQPVKKGDLLIELDASEAESKLEQRKAELKSAIANRDKAKANVALTRKTGVADVSEASSNLRTAKKSVEKTKVTADSKQSAIEKSRSEKRTAEADVRQIQSQIPAAQATLEQAKANVPLTQTQIDLAQTDFDHNTRLFASGDVSKQKLDQSFKVLSEAKTAKVTAQKQVEIAQSQINSLLREVDVAKAKVNESSNDITAAENEYRQSLSEVNVVASQADESTGRLQSANSLPEKVAVDNSEIGTAEARITEAEVAVNQAELELSYTKIYAPQDGYVARKTVQEGQLVQPDQKLMAITQNDLWVIANFKETQLERIKIGQSVEIKIDAYPNTVFKGKVDSFQAGTGSRFSILPAENATGGFVKVVQRVPVKIVFDEMPEDNLFLVPGMSAVPHIKVK